MPRKNKKEAKPRKESKSKKTTKKVEAKNNQMIKDIKPEYYFLMIDGSAIKNLLELADALHAMSDDVFYYHVTNDRNDFGNWVRDVFCENELADELSKLHSKMETQIAVLRHLLKKFL